eukprot:CAMPEP_0119084670 /NCGR_PEP_ID=MMETSP1178-20130426/130639_1 /TAXON_ID=33656 /ORGANISM="unid sp, Strain CCMP2000" /LENGTH=61 /DNA_ID=CAMNT_0007067653 /DNA_START=45 /DNA_END=230 /DNA_ORIENTATION=+
MHSGAFDNSSAVSFFPQGHERAIKTMSANMPSAATLPNTTSCGGTSAPERASAEKKSGMSD